MKNGYIISNIVMCLFTSVALGQTIKYIKWGKTESDYQLMLVLYCFSIAAVFSNAILSSSKRERD